MCLLFLVAVFWLSYQYLCCIWYSYIILISCVQGIKSSCTVYTAHSFIFVLDRKLFFVPTWIYFGYTSITVSIYTVPWGWLISVGVCRRPPWARICKRLRRPGIDSEDSIPPAYVVWRAGTTNSVIVPARQAENRFLGSIKGLQMRALYFIWWINWFSAWDPCRWFGCAPGHTAVI